MKIRIADIVNDSIVDGPGLRLTVFTQGCPHNCKGCHNPQTHNVNGGKIVDTDYILSAIKKNILLDGVTFSGGEPFLQVEPLCEIAREVRAMGLNVITYTGFTFEELMKNESYRPLLELSDYIIDGKFEEDKKSLALQFRGSSNQRIIDVKKSLEENKAIEIQFEEDF